MIELVTMTSSEGLYVSKDSMSYNNVRSPVDRTYTFNGNIDNFENTYHNSWIFLRDVFEITKVEIKQTGYEIFNERWELVDLPLRIELPKVISCEEACEYYDDGGDYDFCIGNESKYYDVRKFYERKYDQKPKPKKEVEFTVRSLGDVSIDPKNNYSDMKVSLYQKGFVDHEKVVNLDSIVEYSELEEMLVPDLEIHNRPCKLSSDNTYKLVRSYIKNNINGRYARVTSDYDFCFTVKKVVKIKPFIKEWEEKKSNGKSYSRPRIHKEEVTNKVITVFEMCPSKPYNKYTPIKGFEGDNLKDLAENVRLYLDELMYAINQPLTECGCCEGRGVLMQDKFKTH